MFGEIMSLAIGNGLWAALFCLLFLYQLKDSRSREKKYTATIGSLTKSLGDFKGMKKDCQSIKEDCEAIRVDCGVIKAEGGKALEGIGELKRGAYGLSKKSGSSEKPPMPKKVGTARKTTMSERTGIMTESTIPKKADIVLVKAADGKTGGSYEL